MKKRARKFDLSIWALGLGYFIFYTPYSGLTKAITNGLLPGMSRPLSGFEILPLSVAATVVGIYGFITVRGWWKYASRRSVLGLSVPVPSRDTFLSGLCMGAIIATTTLAFSFGGASILFVLILLRGGVLIIGPIVDGLEGRRVRWFSWAAMIISLLALLVAFADVQNYKLGLLAVLDIAVYLAAYFFRFRIMTRLAKSADRNMTLRYFVEEQMVATPALLTILVLLAVLGSGDVLAGFRWGLTEIWRTNSVLPAVLVGASYAALMICTTFIFLDRRENTFCIPMHCGSSMMSGVVASIALAQLYHQSPPSVAQYAGTGLIALALAFLSPLHHIRDWVTDAVAEGRLKLLIGIGNVSRRVFDRASAGVVKTDVSSDGRRVGPASNIAANYLGGIRRLLLFVCSGNTSRSPMAEAIGNAEICARLESAANRLGVRALSAGLSVREGSPMTADAEFALREIGVLAHDHASRPITAELVEQATVVYCMTDSHRDALLALHPSAASKTRCLDPHGDIEDPTGSGPEAFLSCAQRLQALIRARLDEVLVSLS